MAVLRREDQLRSFARIGAYWHYNLIFRKEVYKKHGMRFGLH